MSYCDHCGYDYLKHKCIICGAEISTCGCDCARRTCEEHFCVGCLEPCEDLNESGMCEGCREDLDQGSRDVGTEQGRRDLGTSHPPQVLTNRAKV